MALSERRLTFEATENLQMAKVLVLYYSSWGHMEQMAKAAAEGAREAGANVTIKRAPARLTTLNCALSDHAA